MNKKNFFPKLYPLSRELSKTWFIKFQDAAGYTRKKYGALNDLPTVELRLIEAQRMINELVAPGTVIIKQKSTQVLLSNLEAVIEYRRPSLAKKSYQCYCSHLKKFAEWFRPAVKANPLVSPGDFIRHMFECGYHNNYILKAKVILSLCFAELVNKQQYTANPFADIRVKKKKRRSLLPFHPAQIQAIKNLTLLRDPQLWDAILFQYYLFFRPGEIRQLRIGDIIFEEYVVEAHSDITKDHDELRKIIPVPMRPLIEKFRGYPRNWYIFSHNGLPGEKMLSTNNLATRHRKILDALDYSNRYGFYSWVHTGIRESVMSGIPHKQLQLQKGHSDLEVFDEYLKGLRVEDCNQLINQFPAI
jgi:integrase